ncbi:MAG: hypothetical protein HYW65_00110 [Candidatus Liptonbacteria bacterium]|nr:hypothetical protein [Candidatus Liptonbacteria bacterium]MBI3114344.1 hypothetical protein [Candidatus Harrisonbacteria bacterium]
MQRFLRWAGAGVIAVGIAAAFFVEPSPLFAGWAIKNGEWAKVSDAPHEIEFLFGSDAKFNEVKATFSLDKSAYAPGEDILVRGSLVNVGIPQAIIMPRAVAVFDPLAQGSAKGWSGDPLLVGIVAGTLKGNKVELIMRDESAFLEPNKPLQASGMLKAPAAPGTYVIGIMANVARALTYSSQGVAFGFGKLEFTVGPVATPPNLKLNPACDANINASYHRYNQLTWGAVSGASAYKVYSQRYNETPDKIADSWKLIATVADAASTRAPVGKQPSGTGPFTTFYDNGLGHGGPFPAIGANYSYKVTAVVGGQESAASNVVSQDGGADACPAVPPPPPPTLSAALTATPSSGNAPLSGVVLRASAGGTAAGSVNYTFYCNRNDGGTNVAAGHTHKQDGVTASSYSAPADTCNSVYKTPGTYTAKVVVERGALASENRVTVTVASPPPPPPPPVSKPKVNFYISATGNCDAKAKEAEIQKGAKATLCWKAEAASVSASAVNPIGTYCGVWDNKKVYIDRLWKQEGGMSYYVGTSGAAADTMSCVGVWDNAKQTWTQSRLCKYADQRECAASALGGTAYTGTFPACPVGTHPAGDGCASD